MILDLVKNHFIIGESFSPHDFYIKTGINEKVCYMVLKKLYNNDKIGGFVKDTYNYYFIKNDTQ